MEQGSKSIYWHAGKVTRADRSRLNGHGSCALWFTGLSGSGKSTLAVEVERRLHSRRVHTYILDGDNLRHGLSKGLGFTPEDRKENMRRTGEAAKLFVDAGIMTLVTLISPYRSERELVRSVVGTDSFVEIYVRCPLEECERRDPKGLYKRARSNEISEFTGISAPYEEPENPELEIDTSRLDLQQSAGRVLDYLKSRGWLRT
ncbi:adenylyl-sulfate kinase [Paenibacillus sambharensis]|uniref:Adenylyl-sulfate kinase n=1 Tax=Paenibacillus sambharensis TaxID=1803190 RepID=A0A2W1L7X8_9BACL|nr:adenylyl-sulfate kinase [Paenibacillus sambharensis]PZD95366.1 adenylyl-sulfate kinase [Paenibacillus sambharensis]